MSHAAFHRCTGRSSSSLDCFRSLHYLYSSSCSRYTGVRVFFFLTWAPSFCIYGLCHLKVTACSWVSFDGCMHVEVSPCRQRSRTRERANGTDKHLRWLRIPLHSAACSCHRSGSAFNMITGTHVQRAVTHLQSHTHKNTPACLCWIIWKTQREAATCAFMAVWPTFTLGTNTAPR